MYVHYDKIIRERRMDEYLQENVHSIIANVNEITQYGNISTNAIFLAENTLVF